MVEAGLKKWHIVSGIVVVLLVILVVLSVTVIPAGHTGVKITLGRVESTVKEGLNFKIPFIQKIAKMDNRIIKLQADGASVSKDLQSVQSTIAVNYRLLSDNSSTIYKNVGTGYEDTIISPAIQESIKAISSNYTAEELITKRSEVSVEMSEMLQNKITEHGLAIEGFNIVNFSFSKEFDQAIEAKQVAQQNALKAKQDLERIKTEAEQKVASAKADAEAYKLQSRELTNNMVLIKWIETWDGKLPQVSGGDDAAMIVDIGQLTKEEPKQEEK